MKAVADEPRPVARHRQSVAARRREEGIVLDAREPTLIVISLLSKWEAETGIAYVPMGEPVQHGRYWV